MAKVAALGALALLGVGASLFVSPDVEGALGAALALTALMIAVVDAREQIIPDGFALLAFALGVAAVVADFGRDALRPLLDALERAAAMAALFWAFRAAYRAMRGREGMGLGDVKLAAIAGIWLDWGQLPIAVEIAALSALAYVLARRWALKEPIDALARLPFGAFFAPAIWLTWVAWR